MEPMKFLVVWAKIRGYPWWPGVVSAKQIEFSTTRRSKELAPDIFYTVQFIGENSHSSLLPKFIHDFQGFFETHAQTKNKVKYIQWLLNCISAAKQLIEGSLGISELSALNSSLRQKKSNKPTSPLRGLHSKLSKLQELISQKSQEPISNRTGSIDTFQKHLSILSRIVEHQSIEDDGTLQLCETLYELARMEISINVLQHSRIQNLLKIISSVCKQSMSPIIKELGGIVGSLRKFWKGVISPKSLELSESYVANKRLRSKVCRKTASIFEENQFDKQLARELALGIEKKIRKIDPTMSDKYLMWVRRMIREVRVVTPSAYQQMKGNAMEKN